MADANAWRTGEQNVILRVIIATDEKYIITVDYLVTFLPDQHPPRAVYT